MLVVAFCIETRTVIKPRQLTLLMKRGLGFFVTLKVPFVTEELPVSACVNQ
jgi:hypothetical protein